MTTWMDYALAYAKVRWCWDDTVALTEMLADADGRERPDVAVDRLAEKYDLDEPAEPWPYVVEPTITVLRQAISLFMERRVH
jgi:hypothetical protein